jgi:hypothetical protein
MGSMWRQDLVVTKAVQDRSSAAAAGQKNARAWH